MQATSLDLAENIAALCLATLSPQQISMERAFEVISNPSANKQRNRVTVDGAELEALRQLGMTQQEIGDMFGIGHSTVSKILIRESRKRRG